MNQPTQNSSTNSVVVMDEMGLKQFQSLYYLIKGKRDTDIKLFSEIKQFSFNDILELNSKVYKVLELHNKVTDIVNVTIGFRDKEIKTFGSWNEFKSTDWNISSRTKYITIEWDFNIILPNQYHQVPQTHTMRIRIGNNLKPSEMIQVVFQGDDEYDIEEAQSLMSCRIDFINAQICNNLKATVEEWYKSLPKNSEDHKLIKFILKYDNLIKNFIILSFLTSAVILLNYIYKISKILPNNFPTNQNEKFFLFLTSSVAVFYLFYNLGNQYGEKMLRNQINKLERNPIFEITKGDRNRFIEVKNQNSKYLKGLLWSIIIGLATNGLSTLIGMLFEYLSK